MTDSMAVVRPLGVSPFMVLVVTPADARDAGFIEYSNVINWTLLDDGTLSINFGDENGDAVYGMTIKSHKWEMWSWSIQEEYVLDATGLNHDRTPSTRFNRNYG